MLRLSKDQYAQLARSAEQILKKAKHHMKGSGPDDYGAPQMLETYLYRHPLGMLEFCVDDGGIAGSGFKSSFRKLIRQHWVRVQDMVGQLHRGGVSGGGAQRDACAPDRSPGAQEAHRREEAHREGTRSRPPAIARNVRYIQHTYIDTYIDTYIRLRGYDCP